MRLDRKLLLIAPAIVLFCVVAGLAYAAWQLHVLESISDGWADRDAFVSSVEQGKRTLNQRQASGLLRLSLDVEARRTAAIGAARELIVVLTSAALVACVVLAIGIGQVPRTHWPRFRTPAAPD